MYTNPMKYALIALLLLPALALAQVYKHVDEHGRVTFTDQPPEGAQEVKIGPTNTTAPPTPAAYPTKEVSTEVAVVDYSLKITAPTNDTIIPRGPGNFSVSANVTPALASGLKLQLLLDGVPEAAPQSHSTWALTNVFRGTHVLEVKLINEKGKELAKSAGVTVFIFRPSSNF